MRGSGGFTSLPIVIRFACPEDACALAHLAALDEAPLPPEPLLLAEVGGHIWAALSPRAGAHVADPFQPSADVVELLRQRARQLRDGDGRSPAWSRARIPRLLSRTAPLG
jgi:hypothetical protein